jgi:hypothetical protein
MGFDVYNWKDAMFPIVTKWFDDRLAKRTDVISSVIGVEDTKRYSFDEYGIGGLGEVPDYDGTNITEMNQKKGFKTTYTTQEKAGKYPVHFKAAKFDMSGEAKKAGKHMANALSMTALMMFYRLFANGFNASFTGADGQPLFSAAHKVNSTDADVYSNLLTDAFAISAITKAQAQARRFQTFDGLPFLCKFDLCLVSPELEPKAKEYFGKEAKLLPDSPNNNANPVYDMKYFVIDGFSAKQWAVGDSELMKDYIKMVYGTRPMVIDQKASNPLIAEYIGYMDLTTGWSDPKCLIGSNPA